MAMQWLNSANDAAPGSEGNQLDGTHWLRSTQPATQLTNELRRANRFTLDLAVTVTDTSQHGPARILSLSQDPWHRNLTLGQDGCSLVVRLRTPFSGDNGEHPALVVDGVFAPGRERQLRVVYDGRRLAVRDENQLILGRLELRYGAALCHGLFHFDYHDQTGYRLVAFAALFLPPLGLGSWWLRGRRRSKRREDEV